MKNSKIISILIALKLLIEKDENGLEVEIIKYRGIIGFLLYLIGFYLISYLMCACALDLEES